MGQKAIRRAKFFSEHPSCIFCGGDTPATTIEHCPPRGMFRERVWPDGFEFPACAACNGGTSDADLLVAFLKRCADPGDTVQATNAAGTILATKKQLPEVLQQMGGARSSAIEARRLNRRFGTHPGPGELHRDVSPMPLPKEAHTAIPAFGGKLAKGIYYMKAREAFSSNGCLLLHWFTNTELVRTGSYPVLDAVRDFPASAIPVTRGNMSLDEQFRVRAHHDPTTKLVYVEAEIGRAFAFVVVGCSQAGFLEHLYTEALGANGVSEAFDVLQSTILPVGPRRGSPR